MHRSAGGAPLLGEPVSLEFANTVFAVRGRPTEGLESAHSLAEWLRDKGFAVDFAVDEVKCRDLDAARTLRTAIRDIAAAVTGARAWDVQAVETVNAYAASTPRWRELTIEPEPRVTWRSSGGPVDAALGVIADDAIGIFGGASRDDLRACPGPNCILYFLTDGRREWCSKTCGNRARAARHYAKTQQAKTQQAKTQRAAGSRRPGR